ncbi:ubiquinol oxidase subunit II (plasmid) [Paroceanicella profunda]|uniref:Ubiquinol oxidase subunit 2 n=1 Tax=Paroceanicella profunda TaxID=2579971 RepID=A0A5B8FZP6_9RHOB|nr:ubiquinol oxidase subunit II [Paroceanicella profunda]QDL94386.1 ubiquinol oxidase subunit II [Paroceanicella profunda]
MIARILRRTFLLALLPLLAACRFPVLDPKGQIGIEERNLIVTATLLMLIVVIPVIVMTLLFAWRYRDREGHSGYLPDWSHSGKIEAVVWAVPCVIIAVLAVITWNSSHDLDPYKPIDHDLKPINIQVVALDWKWLFIYPDEGIATVNEIVVPADRPLAFSITSSAMMNSFSIPELGGQIYAMAGMETKLHLIANEQGTFDGLSANYSGAGFSDMQFKVRAVSDEAYSAWIDTVHAGHNTLDGPSYETLAQPSSKVEASFFAQVTPGLFDDIVRNKYMVLSHPVEPRS